MRFSEIISEDANPKRQAAIAIAMKKAGKKPKNEDFAMEDEQIDGMAQGEIRAIIKNAIHIKNQLDRGVSLDGWMYSYVTTSNDHLNSVAEQINNPNIDEQGVDEGWSQKYKNSINCSNPKGFSQKAHCAGKKKQDESIETDQVDENLHQWFKEKWVRFGPDGKIRGDCARGSESEGKPKCLPQSKAHSLGKKGRASAAARKRREDPNANRSGKAINVSTKGKGK